MRPVTEIEDDLTALLATSNGRRRERICDLRDAVQAVREAITSADWIGYATGGTVAKSYGYRACTTIVHARREGVREHARVIVTTRTNDAAYVAHPGYQPLRECSRDNWVVVTLAEARQLVRTCDRRRNEPGVQLLRRQSRSVTVTREDSIGAGNCYGQTDRIIGRMGLCQRASIVSGTLIDWILLHAPHLAAYAARAIRQAVVVR